MVVTDGRKVALATGRPCSRTPINTPKVGRPFRKFVVPSSGSMTHVTAAARSAPSSDSSDSTACSGNRRAISPRK